MARTNFAEMMTATGFIRRKLRNKENTMNQKDIEARGAAVNSFHVPETTRGIGYPEREERAVRHGFDVALAYSRGEWVAIRSADDLPKVGCDIWLQNPNGEIFTDAFCPHFPGNTLQYYLDKVAWMPNEKPAPYQPQEQQPVPLDAEGGD